ncbi:MAG: TonB-dependent receptor [Flavobacterium sp.]|uniref:TonB-dependent receptor plug domain-containing protein n=1 Tax=Flavobacterium sp. TaxID=239 RepID=UPI001202EE86|nr:TonB-dependent receptor [Flavobacterium sp.]RZJ67821.1 MAG: TonB-dependent receptor [Flavobacterium sp.]
MTAKKLFFFIGLLMCQTILAQTDTIALHDVTVSDAQLKRFSTAQHVISLNDSTLRGNSVSLATLLQFNSGLYIKENGLGSGVASPSFRGTTAQQTAVVWNGININSQFNGQTDFNTIATSGFNSVDVRSGGGSVIYGSSAIGGSIHLNNDIRFGNHFENTVVASYGSFDTRNVFYRADIGTEKFALQATVSRNASDNDYEFPNATRDNINGQFENTGLNLASGYKLNAKNYVRFYSQVFDGERHFPLLTPTDTKTKYRDFNTRNLLEWVNLQTNFTSKFKLAYLNENYTYFGNVTNDSHSYGAAETFIARYDLTYEFGAKASLNAITDYTQTSGRGSDVDDHRRDIGSGALLFKHKVLKRLTYEIGVRKEITGNYDSPVLYSVGANYKVADFYDIRLSGSRNFRIPTFNDLYWADGGNPDLKPESSYQGEIGNDFKFKNVTISVNGYYMKIKDMIQWLPGTTASWFPQNVNRVEAYGAEIVADAQRRIGKHEIKFNGTYSYTISENEKTQNQLIYVPFHKATASIAYGYRKFSANVQSLFNGEVFTRSDNNERYNLDAYSVANAGIAYDFGTKNTYRLGFQVRNFLDAEYYTMERRPYPGRNYNLSLILIL